MRMMARLYKAYRIAGCGGIAKDVMEALLALHLPLETIEALAAAAGRQGIGTDALVIGLLSGALKKEAVHAES